MATSFNPIVQAKSAFSTVTLCFNNFSLQSYREETLFIRLANAAERSFRVFSNTTHQMKQRIIQKITQLDTNLSEELIQDLEGQQIIDLNEVEQVVEILGCRSSDPSTAKDFKIVCEKRLFEQNHQIHEQTLLEIKRYFAPLELLKLLKLIPSQTDKDWQYFLSKDRSKNYDQLWDMYMRILWLEDHPLHPLVVAILEQIVPLQITPEAYEAVGIHWGVCAQEIFRIYSGNFWRGEKSFPEVLLDRRLKSRLPKISPDATMEAALQYEEEQYAVINQIIKRECSLELEDRFE